MTTKQEIKAEESYTIEEGSGEVIQWRGILNEKGQEVLDPIPLAPPVNYQKPFDMFAHIQDMIRGEHVRLKALEAGAETFEEADDFEVGDDYDPTSPHEEVFDPVGDEVRRRLREADYRAQVKAQYDRLLPQNLKEAEDGSSSVDEGRRDIVGGGSGRSDTKSKGKSGKKQDAADGGGVHDADRGDREVEE